MHRQNHYRKSYRDGQRIEVKCKFLSEIDCGYEAVGVRRENLELHISDDEKEKIGTEELLWYKVEGKVQSADGYDLVVDVQNVEEIGTKVNDWIYNTVRGHGDAGGGRVMTMSSNSVSGEKQNFQAKTDGGSQNLTLSTEDMNASPATSEDMSGFATGGGKDIENFRQNIRNGLLPRRDSISYEGILYEYEFDIGSRDKDALFYPNYEQSVSENPVTGETERYLTVGLDSGMDSFERPPLDLMFVVDISGSMGSPMNEYYYDGEQDEPSERKSKMEATKDVLKNIVKKLEDNDRYGVVLYNQEGMVAKPIRKVIETDVEDIVSEIDILSQNGGTNLSNGFETAVDEMEFGGINTKDENRESRVMFITDAMPNMGNTEGSSLKESFQDAAEDGTYTTFIGIGIDSNPELIDMLSSTRGANHYFVDSVEEFNSRINEEFNYTVTPLVFNLDLTVEGEGFTIDGVYGSPNEDASSTGQVMHVETLFPSHGDEGTKGGVIVVSMSEADVGDEIRISTSWTERGGEKGGDVTRVQITDEEPNYYDSVDTQKAVLLCQYAELVQQWLESTEPESSGDWERKSTNIRVSDEYGEKIETFMNHFQKEAEKIGDENLENELDILRSVLEN
jgi:Ca-activated chloride channel family protein